MESADNHRHILLPYQQRWVNDKSPLKIWLAARQVGKSFALAMEAVTECLEGKCSNMILSSSERQSREVMLKVYTHLRYFRVRSNETVRAERETREEVTLPNGSRIISLPSSPDTVRGFSGNVFLDEFAFHRDSKEIWRAMYPAITRGFKLRVSSTPNGKQDMFYRLWNTENKNISKHRVDIHDAKKQGLNVDVEALRLGMTDPEAWAQEFECQFVDSATAYITYEQIAACEDPAATKEFTLRDSDGPPGEFYLGLDIGRKKDLTVFWLWERKGDVLWTRMVREMKGTAFRLQREFLYSLLEGSFTEAHGLPGARLLRCCIDSSGLGAQLAEEAVERFGHKVEAVTFTNPVKEGLAVTFRRKIEERQVRLPQDREVREDIHSISRLATASGNTRFDAERSKLGHADRFWAGALGLHAAETPVIAVSYEKLDERRFHRQDRTW